MYNNTSSPILRGGHGGNDNEITPGGHYHRPAVEDDFDTLEEHQHVQGRAVESTEVQDRLQNHRVEGDDQVGRLHAQDCAASGTKEDVGYIKGAISNELSLEEKRFQDRTRVYPQPDDERRRAHGSRQTSDNARQKPKSEKQRLVERIEEVSGFLTHLYELYYIEQDREEEQRRQRAAESKRRASEAAQQPSASVYKIFSNKDKEMQLWVMQCCKCFGLKPMDKKAKDLGGCLDCQHVLCEKCLSQIGFWSLQLKLDSKGRLI